MKILKSLSLSACVLITGSCGIIDLKNLGSNAEITETKDVITEDLKYTSDRLEDIFENSKQRIKYVGHDRVTIDKAIKLSPYLIKTQSELLYYLKLLVIGQTSTATNELFFRCNGTSYMAHKLTKEEIEGINSQFHIIPTGKTTSFRYQDEIIETKINKDLFNYIVSCKSDLILRAKGNKSSMDALIQKSDPENMDFFNGLEAIKTKAESLNLSAR